MADINYSMDYALRIYILLIILNYIDPKLYINNHALSHSSLQFYFVHASSLCPCKH